MAVKVRAWKGQKGVWGVFIDHRGQRASQKVGSKEAAVALKRELELSLAKGDFKIPQRGLTFKALAEDWIKNYGVARPISETSAENYASVIKHHLVPFFGSMPVADIDLPALERYVAAKRAVGGSLRRKDRGLADSAIKSSLSVLRSVLDRAVRVHRIIDHNPCVGAFRFTRQPTDHVDPFTPKALRAILTAARDIDARFATFIGLWAGCGARAGEMLGLRHSDIDLKAGTVGISRTLTRGRIGPTKTRQARVVRFMHPVFEDTAEWRSGVTAESRSVLADLKKLPTNVDPDTLLFPWSTQRVSELWRRALVKAGVRYRNPEQLRHTLASTLLSRNAPLIYVTKQGGWRSASVLLGVYAKYIEQGEHIAEADVADKSTSTRPGTRPAASSTAASRLSGHVKPLPAASAAHPLNSAAL